MAIHWQLKPYCWVPAFMGSSHDGRQIFRALGIPMCKNCVDCVTCLGPTVADWYISIVTYYFRTREGLSWKLKFGQKWLDCVMRCLLQLQLEAMCTSTGRARVGCCIYQNIFADLDNTAMWLHLWCSLPSTMQYMWCRRWCNVPYNLIAQVQQNRIRHVYLCYTQEQKPQSRAWATLLEYNSSGQAR